MGATDHPTAAWLTKAARNLAMDLQDAGDRARYIIRDPDGKYPKLFDAILADTGIKVILAGVQIPRMNAVMERWIQSCRVELLDRMLIWNQANLLRALHHFERHSNEHRPHRAMSSARPLKPLPEPIIDLHRLAHLDVRRRNSVGGIIHEYEHAA